MRIIQFILFLICCSRSSSFASVKSQKVDRITSVPSQLSASPVSSISNKSIIEGLKTDIEQEISGTKRGLSANISQRKKIDSLVQQLENACQLAEPARSPLMGGKWIVDYTTSPPPSNGKLGPFVGFARQIIDLNKGTYINYLSVPGDLDKEWLSAELAATFSEWNGIFLQDDRQVSAQTMTTIDEDDSRMEDANIQDGVVKRDVLSSLQSIIFGRGPTINTNTEPDYGASNWKVDFQTLTIKVFGIPLITKTFENTSRVWKMSYLDEQTRVGE